MSPARRSLPHWLLVAMLSVGPCLFAAAASDRAPAEVQLLADRLRDAPAPLRAEFASAVLAELIAAYRREARRARAELTRAPGANKLARWLYAVEAMLYELQTLQKTLSADTPVLISEVPGQTVQLIVAGYPVLLSGPGDYHNEALAQAVLTRFCQRNYCADLLAGDGYGPTPTAAPDAPPLWRFSDRMGPVCDSGDGLELQFRDTADLESKREACARVVADLHALIALLREEAGRGIVIDWNLLALEATPDPEFQRVILNADGDAVLAELPALQAAPILFVQVLPWVAARVGGRTYHLVILNCDTKLGLTAPGDE